MQLKQLRIDGQPCTDSDFNVIKVSRKQADAIAKKRERDFRRLQWGRNAHGFVFEAAEHLNVTLGFGRLKNA